MRRLLILGMGFCARRFVALHGARFDHIAATARTGETAERVRRLGCEPVAFEAGGAVSPGLAALAAGATHVLVSIPPGAGGDATLDALRVALGAARPTWIGYLSSVVVYGDQGGGRVDEAIPARPSSDRGRRRLAAEAAWLGFGAAHGVAVQVFRLAGIYGPGRNALANLAAGRARRIVKPGQAFNRIHVDDVAAALWAGIERPSAGPLFSLADDEAAPSDAVVAFAASLLGREPPAAIPYEQAVLSPMAADFWAENKRVDNTRTKQALGLTLAYPTYREGLRALCAAGEGKNLIPDGNNDPGATL
jgi:nucleoside-diphosphate-sugar epimerase